MEVTVRVRTTTDEGDDTGAGNDVPLVQRARLRGMELAALHRMRPDAVQRERELVAQMKKEKAEMLAAHANLAGNCSANPDH